MASIADKSTLASRLSGRGIRLTKQRRFLIDLIEKAQGHLHPSDLLRLAREKDERIDRATVYRTLSLLKAEGLIEEHDLLHLDGAAHHYEHKRQKAHVHIGCRRCAGIVELESGLVDKLEAEIRQETGFDVESIRIEVAGLCPKCQSAG
ncbi:MAG: Fur family transcriptional regulator [Armatimonadota bacterium]